MSGSTAYQSPRTAVSNPPVTPVAAGFGEADLVRRSATGDLPPPQRQLTPVAKLIDVSKCIGCKACQSACIEWNDTAPDIGSNHGIYDNPRDLTENMFTLMRFTEWVNPETDNLEWLIRKDGCMHCADPGCLRACPAPGAIVQYTNGIVDFIHENCIGCGYCVKGCPFNIPRISKADHRSYKCTLCSDRVAVGQGPACAKACPTQAIVFGTKEDMKRHAEGRIADLKSRGYANAGLYDPPGVGGTHVMYVLHHNDKPGIYSGLPENPRISPIVQTWKGVTKYVGLAAMGFLAAGSLIHGVFARPNRVTEEDDEHGEDLVHGKPVPPPGPETPDTGKGDRA
ncbi:formate dehydrogenase subunit beta [Pararoseomonas sp. SCSIO 73927]|uniref:formate dehydrogenase subunit beta n=1 Tax=Pararoseomonas sp. SCSIO 73927 TaxID=3114537 RepID=UPI0030CCA764